MVLLQTRYITAFIAPQVYLLPTETYLKLSMYAMVMRSVYVICDPAHLLNTAIGGTGENSISIFK